MIRLSLGIISVVKKHRRWIRHVPCGIENEKPIPIQSLIINKQSTLLLM